MRKIASVVADTIVFAVKTAIVVICLFLATSVPEIVKTVYRYCLSGDSGMMWVVNMAIAIIVAIVTWVRLTKKRKWKGWFKALMSVLSFVITLVVVASFWHAEEISNIIVGNHLAENIRYIVTGVACATVAYVWHTIPTWDDNDDARITSNSDEGGDQE